MSYESIKKKALAFAYLPGNAIRPESLIARKAFDYAAEKAIQRHGKLPVELMGSDNLFDSIFNPSPDFSAVPEGSFNASTAGTGTGHTTQKKSFLDDFTSFFTNAWTGFQSANVAIRTDAGSISKNPVTGQTDIDIRKGLPGFTGGGGGGGSGIDTSSFMKPEILLPVAGGVLLLVLLTKKKRGHRDDA